MTTTTPNFLFKVTDKNKIEHVTNIIKTAYGMPLDTRHVPVDNPVSLDRINMNLLKTNRYKVAFKADGVRYLLVLCMYNSRYLACMVDRAGNVYSLHINATIPHFTQTSVFDGELCECSTSKGVYDYLVFNALVIMGESLKEESYSQRLHYLSQMFSSTPKSLEDRSKSKNYIWAQKSQLNLIRKEYDDACQLRSMIKCVIPRYNYDGFIFTPNDEHICPGQNDKMFKYKTDNPIDVTIHIVDGNVEIYVDADGDLIRLQQVVDIPVVFNIESSEEFISIYKGSMVYNDLFQSNNDFKYTVEMDCKVVDSKLILSFLRLRPDKDGPNNVRTIHRTLKTIQDNIKIEEVLNLLVETKFEMFSND